MDDQGVDAGPAKPAAAVVKGIVYVVGGFSGPNWVATVQAYDPATDTWTSKASMPTARSAPAVGVVNGILYAVGGNASGSLATVEAYDPATNTWTTKASMPTARSGLAAGVVNGILYAVGGSTGNDRLGTVEAYDPATNTWTSKASMPTARKDLAAGVVNGILYFVGGADVTYTALATVDAYEPSSGDEPVFNTAAGDVMIFEDDMERYTTPHDADITPAPSFHSFFSDQYPNNYAVINPAHGNGNGLRLVYINGNGERFLWKTEPEVADRYDPNDAAVVVQYWFRISRNGGPGGSPGYGNTTQGMKWVEFWPVGGAERTQFGPTAGDPTTGPLWHVNPASAGPSGYQPVGPYWNQVNDHEWHRATYLYQPRSNSVGATDGVARMWIDGTKIVDISATAADITPPGGTKAWCTMAEVRLLDSNQPGGIYLGEYMNGGFPEDLPMALDFDDFKWWKLPARVQ